MKSYKNSSLKKYNTFRLEHTTSNLIEIENEEEIIDIVPILNTMPYLIIGSGSNLLFTKNFEGLIVKTNLFGKTVIQETENDVLLSVKAGEIWHDFVDWTLKNGYYGLENLALIPGTVGASPVQNIGAYGIEVQDYIEKVKVFDLEEKTWKWFSKENCEFEYRNSYFKRNLGRFIVTEVVFKLKKTSHVKIEYGAIKTVLNDKKITNPTPRDVFSAVIEIRTSKLPDPDELGNAGSFFKNPIVDKEKCDLLLQKFPNLVHYTISETKEKIAAGWLIEQAGWKGKTFDGFGVYPKQSLILVNYHLRSGAKLKTLSEDIQNSILDKFDIHLEPEVQIF